MAGGSGFGVSYQTMDKQGDIITTYPDGDGPYIYEQDVQYANPVNGINYTSLTATDIGSTFTASLNGSLKFVISHGPSGETDITYIVTGQPYAEQTVSYDPSGAKIELDRYYANSKPQMIATYNSDGSLNSISDYDINGRITESQKYASDGSHTVALDTYGSANATTPSSVALYNYDSHNHLASIVTTHPMTALAAPDLHFS